MKRQLLLKQPGAISFGVMFIASVVTWVSPAAGQLSYFYDPLTGNVSFDTSETRTGEAILYGFRINESHSNVRFDLDQWIRLSSSSLVDEYPNQIAEVTYGQPWSGLYTIGDVLPAGLSEAEWFDLFGGGGTFAYADQRGGGPAPTAELVYGRPDGEFDNQFDLLDPDSLTWATEASLIFDERDGRILLDTTGSGGGYISWFWGKTDGYSIDEAALTLPSAPGQVEVTSNAFLYATDALEPGRYDLGAFLGTDISGIEFLNAFSEAVFLGRAGFGRRNLDLETEGASFNLSIVTSSVPEPSSAVVMMLSLSAFCVRRSRKF